MLLTFDRDFGDLVFRGGQPTCPGILYLRDSVSPPEELAERLVRLVARPDIDIGANFITVRRDDIRQRPLPTQV